MKSSEKLIETGRKTIKQIGYSETSATKIDIVELYSPENKLYYLVIQTFNGNPKKAEWVLQGQTNAIKTASQKIIL
ncbi:hypothetical protein ACPWRU_16130 (plasmid) [Lactiplantibacillus plantarum subsp. plantarum]|uniref:hypothetical protein n=1 Tax=Lactiplantibacillus plantarum TaxID=1590 RepID=UPI003F819A3E